MACTIGASRLDGGRRGKEGSRNTRNRGKVLAFDLFLVVGRHHRPCDLIVPPHAAADLFLAVRVVAEGPAAREE